MEIKQFKVGEVLSVILGKDLVPEGKAKVVSFFFGEEKKNPTLFEIRKCRKALRKQFDFREKVLEKEFSDLELQLQKVEKEEEAQKIIDNWVQMIKERFYKNRDFIVVRCFQGGEEKKNQFIPPFQT